MYLYRSIIKVVYLFWLCEEALQGFLSCRCVAERVDDSAVTSVLLVPKCSHWRLEGLIVGQVSHGF